MKKLFYFCVGMLVMATYSCRPNQAERYQRYLEDMADSTFEYVTPKADSLNADGEPIVPEGEVGGGWANDDGLVAVPDIPKERRVNMSASERDLERVMSGKE
jgi:hypothetical protein